ncbi:MAG: hypothetical protein CBC35_10660 [Planctomycetes bacterium TMED75]|nr:MAG: hypothetical protein CBC35_10660 [Planctomycetes bacterium TMED75]
MCTLTILPRSPGESTQCGFRLVFSRDEQRTRASGTDPVVERTGVGHAILPRDPVGGGTWIATNDRGLAFALLNVNPPEIESSTVPGLSRGILIPELLSCHSLDAVRSGLEPLVAQVRRPFRLVVTDGDSVLEALGGSGRVHCTLHPLDRPFMRSSSGLGDHVVEPIRRAAFERTLLDADSVGPSEQDAFHQLRFEGRDECSIDMSRADACTVSWTVIEMDSRRACMRHHQSPPREQPAPITLEIDRLTRIDQSGRVET